MLELINALRDALWAIHGCQIQDLLQQEQGLHCQRIAAERTEPRRSTLIYLLVVCVHQLSISNATPTPTRAPPASTLPTLATRKPSATLRHYSAEIVTFILLDRPVATMATLPGDARRRLRALPHRR